MKSSRVIVLFALGAATLLAAAAPADVHRHGGRRPGVHHHHHAIRPSFRFYWGPSWGWWGPWWTSAAWASYPRVYPNATYGAYGALDTDVSPERAEIWVDGKKVGLADDFDGFPDYLWLPKGTYDVVIYLPGYRTIARQYTIYPGLVVDVEDRLERGESTHPLDLGPTTHARRDARIQADAERRREIDAQQRDGAEAPSWRENDRNRPEDGAFEPLDARAEPGRLVLQIDPADASVYLDGRFLGTGNELRGLRGGLLIDPGEHRIEVVRPGLESTEEAFVVESGREVELSIALEKD